MTDTSSAQPQPDQFTPPVHLNDPYVRRMNVSRPVWARALRGRIPKPADAAVARALAEYGNAKGENCHPGIERLANDTCMSTASVKRSIAWLAEHGWITRTARSARKLGLADVWCCTIPATVAMELGKWDMSVSGRVWMERPPSEPKRPGMLNRPAPRKRGPKPKDLQGSETPVEGIRNSVVELRNSGSRDHSSDLSPLSYVTTSSSRHHSESVNRPHADAWGDEEDLHEQIEERAEETLGHALYACTGSLIDGMLMNGAHPNAVLNAVLARERDPLAWGA